MANGKLQVASGKWQVGEPSDGTNFGSHANSGIGSHFGQTKFLAIHSASPKIKRVKSGLIAHLDGRKRGKGGMRPYYLPRRYGRKWKKTELRPYEFLNYTAANREKEECGRTTHRTNTAAIGKRQSCGRTEQPQR